MAELFKAFQEARDDVKSLIKALVDLNQNFKTFQQGVKTINEFAEIMKRNEKVVKRLVAEMKRMNDNFELLERIIREVR